MNDSDIHGDSVHRETEIRNVTLVAPANGTSACRWSESASRRLRPRTSTCSRGPTSPRATTPPVAELFPKAQAFERMFVAAGGLLAAGVDPTGMGGALPGHGDQRNYELLLESGFQPRSSRSSGSRR